MPVLRRPPGWSLLDESALRIRAVSLYHACVPQALAGDVAQPKRDEALAVPIGGAPLAAATPPVPVPPQDMTPPAGSPPLLQALPWLVVGVGLVLITPWLIWAPLVGGVCLGILLLQTGLLRRWLANRHAFNEPTQATDPGLQRLEPERGAPRQAWKHSGWLLTAVLVLVGVQAAMLFTTVQIRRSADPMQRGAGSESSGKRSSPAGKQADDRDAVIASPLPVIPSGITPRSEAASTDRSRQAETTR